MSSEQHHNSGHAESHTAAAEPPKISKKSVGVFLFCVLVVAVILAASGIVTRIHAEKRLASDTNANAIPVVSVIDVQEGEPSQELILPGNIQAYRDTPIYARVDGYLQKWYVDIGGRVKRGQLLAVIDAPEVDQQLQQAQADLATAQSNLKIAQITAARYSDLLKTNSVSRQEEQNFSADAQSRTTMVHAAEANVKRLEQLQGFERITAPFDGVITARNIDNGQLITAGSTGTGTTAATNGRELFHIAAINTLRVYISVPQIYSRDAGPSTPTYLVLSQYPGRKFPGKLVRNANAIDTTTRTLLVEVDVDNRKGELLPGSYTEVHLKLKNANPSVIVPVSALIFRSEGLRIAVLNGDRAHLVPVVPGRDYGTQMEIVAGLKAGDRIIDSPPDSLMDQEVVRVVRTQKQSSATKPAA